MLLTQMYWLAASTHQMPAPGSASTRHMRSPGHSGRRGMSTQPGKY